MYDVFELKNEVNLSGVKLSKLKVKPLNAKTLQEAKNHPAYSPEFEKTLVLGVFTELCDDDFELIYANDYVRMLEVVETMLTPPNKEKHDFLPSSQ